MNRAYLFLFVLFASCITSYADGGFIPKEPSAYFSLREDQQIAVIDVLDRENIEVNMFLSLTDRSNTSNEVIFFLPVYEKPRGFMVEEMGYDSFNRNYTKEYDDFIEKNTQWREDAKSRILLSSGLGWMTAGGPAFLSLLSWQLGVFKVGQGMSSTDSLGGSRSLKPDNVYVTAHSITEAYGVSSEEDLEALLSMSNISEEAKQRVRDYGASYLYLITLKTVPNPEVDSTGYKDVRMNSLGMHFSFVTNAKQDVYAYPLGTGKKWYNTIKLTRVYVRNTRAYSVDIAYPILGQKASWHDYYDLDLYETRYDVSAAEDEGHMITRITYLNSNPGDDVVVSIRDAGIVGYLEGVWVSIWRPFYGIVVPIALFLMPLFFWLIFYKRFLGKAALYPSKMRMYLSGVFYFAINSFVQTSLSWVAIFGGIGIYFAVMSLTMDHWHGSSDILVYVILGLILLLFLLELALGAYIVACVHKVRYHLNKALWTRFLLVYILSLICFFAASAFFYFLV